MTIVTKEELTLGNRGAMKAIAKSLVKASDNVKSTGAIEHEAESEIQTVRDNAGHNREEETYLKESRPENCCGAMREEESWWRALRKPQTPPGRKVERAYRTARGGKRNENESDSNCVKGRESRYRISRQKSGSCLGTSRSLFRSIALIGKRLILI